MGSVKSRSWRELARFYRGLIEEHGWNLWPMLRLVEAIAASRYAQGVYAATSLAVLYLSQHSEFEFEQNTVRVEFANGGFAFRYRESPYDSKEWKKECEADEGFATFEHVMKKLRWFID
jgi:hypothetical protein